MTKLKTSKRDKTQGDKTQKRDTTKKKMWQNWRLEILKNSKTQNVTKLKTSKFNKTNQLKIWQSYKTQNVTKHKDLICDKP